MREPLGTETHALRQGRVRSGGRREPCETVQGSGLGNRVAWSTIRRVRATEQAW